MTAEDTKWKTLDITTSKVSMVEHDDSFNRFSVHTSEWWNGEGVDVTVCSEGKEAKFELYIGVAEALFGQLIALGYVDVRECETFAERIKQKSNERQQAIDRIRSNGGA